MKNPFKKILNMEDKDPNVSEQEGQLLQEEQVETLDQQPENYSNTQENTKLLDLQKQLEESKNKFLYLFSDFENFKRHAARERIDLIQTANRDVLSALLPIMDDFDRAAKNGGLPEGIVLIHNKMQNTLEQKGLKLLALKPGDAFNADFHEAVAEIPAASDELKGKIVDILEQGYMLGERIIRFAKVVVGK
jgi:molecular chaperone GrpE